MFSGSLIGNASLGFAFMKEYNIYRTVLPINFVYSLLLFFGEDPVPYRKAVDSSCDHQTWQQDGI